MNLLLSSNSTLYGEKYLAFCKDEINSFLAKNNAKKVIFIPFAAVSFSYDDYEKNVIDGLENAAIQITSIHHYEDKKEAVNNADAVIVGGGNTFHLLHEMYAFDLLDPIRKKVQDGMPYIGWSAGSNLACPTIKTTNDMPIIEPPSFNALNLIPFQINPHYLDANPDRHNGETREQRITEFVAVNKNVYVGGLREGTMLIVENNSISLVGNLNMRLFKHGQEPKEYAQEDHLNFLMG